MVYIVLVNWNGWRDTIACISSLYNMSNTDFRVIVCDNGSSDDSIEHITEWIEKKQRCDCSNSPVHVARMPDITCRVIRRDEIYKFCEPTDVTIIDSKVNAGFAAGCNLGIRCAASLSEVGYVWLLNNDTVVDPDALSALMERLSMDEKIAMCGSLLMHYHDPQTIQAFGGEYDKFMGTSRHYLEGGERQAAKTQGEGGRVNYVVGASMMCKKSFLYEAGLLDEDYYLYNEEIDLAFRAAQLGYKIAHAEQSIVYHKVGGSIDEAASKTRSIDYYIFRNRLLIARKYTPGYLPFVIFRLLGVFLLAVVKGDRTKSSFFIDPGFWFAKGKRSERRHAPS